jgi:hypothetical protein
LGTRIRVATIQHFIEAGYSTATARRQRRHHCQARSGGTSLRSL